jgi:DNA repair protein RadC
MKELIGSPGRKYPKNQETVVIGAVSRRKPVPQVKVIVSRGKSYDDARVITNSDQAVDAFRTAIGRNLMETRECFLWMYLSASSKIIGIQKQTLGTDTQTTVDIKTGIKGALDVAAKSIVIAHNHPSGRTDPSEADVIATKSIQRAAAYFNIGLSDSLIITKKGFGSISFQS